MDTTTAAVLLAADVVALVVVVRVLVRAFWRAPAVTGIDVVPQTTGVMPALTIVPGGPDPVLRRDLPAPRASEEGEARRALRTLYSH